MTSCILQFLSERPIYGIDATSMSEWKLDCEKEWDIISDTFIEPIERNDFLDLLDIYLTAYYNLSITVNSSAWPLSKRKESVFSLLHRPQVEQRTDAWYEEARCMLTASQFAIILQKGLTRGQLVLEKAKGVIDTSQRRTVVLTMELNPFTWGIRFEPVVNQIYCHLTKSLVKEMGRLKHKVDRKLAASPDGMVIEGPDDCYGRFVEFKAPVTRKILNVVPKDYIVQMQIQMEVGDVEECDYLEVKFQSTYGLKPPPEKQVGTYYGELHVIGNQEELAIRYEYSPLNTLNLKPTLQETECILETIYWSTSEYYLTTVKRSREWFSSVKPAMESFWKDVESAKQGTFVLPESLRVKKDVVCKIMDE